MGKKLTTDEFIERAKKVHGEEYEYSLAEYKNAKTKARIICKEHGIFEQLPHGHMNGTGCTICGNIKQTKKRTLTTEQFIKKARSQHGSLYNYSNSIYKNARSKVIVTCTEHGDFEQIAYEHYKGQGCPKCGNIRISNKIRENPIGWSYSNWQKIAEKSKNFDSFKVYVIKCWNDNEEFYKIGKTFVTVEKRFIYNKEMPYSYKILKIIKANSALEICEIEKQLQKNNKEYLHTPKIKFNGMYECFSKLKEI